MNNQAIYSIGLLGSVSDGKSTLIQSLTGTKTQKHSNEKIRNITIKQGYANMKVWENDDGIYTTNSEHISNDNLINHISFVDCPGHHDLINTMLSSISLMNGAIVVISTDQILSKKPQLMQHLAAIKLSKLDKIIICLNKIDLVKKQVILERKNELDQLLKQYDIKPYIIIPTCFNKKIGLNHVINSIMTLFNPQDEIKKTTNPLFIISRSFDINKPGTNWKDINGGVIGGTIISGKFSINDEIEIRPGRISKDVNGVFTCNPIHTNILSIKSENTELIEASFSGLIAFKTGIDPYYCKNDGLLGNVVGIKDEMPNVYIDINLKIDITTLFDYKWEPKPNVLISLQIGTRVVEGKLGKLNNIILTKPTCICDNQHIIICKNIDRTLKIVGDGIFDYKINKKYII